MTNYIQTNQCIQLTAPTGAGTYAVSAVDSGKIFLVPVLGGAGANTLAVTMPALQAGLRYKFLAQGTLASVMTFTPAVAANIVRGTLINKTGAAALAFVTKAGSANAQLTDLAVVGDYIEFICDGSSWMVTGVSSAVGLT